MKSNAADAMASERMQGWPSAREFGRASLICGNLVVRPRVLAARSSAITANSCRHDAADPSLRCDCSSGARATYPLNWDRMSTRELEELCTRARSMLKGR